MSRDVSRDNLSNENDHVPEKGDCGLSQKTNSSLDKSCSLSQKSDNLMRDDISQKPNKYCIDIESQRSLPDTILVGTNNDAASRSRDLESQPIELDTLQSETATDQKRKVSPADSGLYSVSMCSTKDPAPRSSTSSNVSVISSASGHLTKQISTSSLDQCEHVTGSLESCTV